MNISIHSERLDLHVAAWLYIAATQIPGVHVTHPDEADLIINVDSIHNSGMLKGKKTAYYEVDDNLHQGKNVQYYDVDLLYIVTKENLPLYPSHTKVLPVAMEPTIHYHWPFMETYDMAFIGQADGNDCYAYRRKILDVLTHKFNFLYEDSRPQNYPKRMSQAKIRVNIMPQFEGKSPLIITRFYESMGIGATLNDYHSSIDDIGIVEGKHYIGFTSPEDAIEKGEFYLRNDTSRIEIGNTGRALMLEKHTWRHRLLKILEDYEKL